MHAAPPPPAAPVAATVTPVPTTSTPPDAVPVAKTTSIIDDEHPHAFDGQLKSPGIATMRAVSEKEAWLEFSVMEGTSYDAIVNLETSCVSETFARADADELAQKIDADTDQEVVARLQSAAGQAAVGEHLARLARFAENEISAVMVHGHSDGRSAVTDDHQKLAVASRRRLFLSLDGGHSWARADRDSVGVIGGLVFSPNGRYVLYQTTSGFSAINGNQPPPSARVAVIDTAATLPASPAFVDTDACTPLQVSTPEGLLLFAHRTERCIYGIDPAAPALRKVSCVPGPKIDKNHFFFIEISPSGKMGMELQGDFQTTRGFVFAVDGHIKTRQLKGAYELHNAHVGPDDSGRYAWENRYDVLRIDGPEGVRDLRMGGSPLGFDLHGNVLLFQQPPLVRVHKPGTMMPPAKGTLIDNRCTLLRKTTP